jgi:hypothetical protein
MTRASRFISVSAISVIAAAITLLSACQQPTPESGYEIPGFYVGPSGMTPAYDQIQISPFLGNLMYHGRIETTEIVLGSGADAPHVVYRNDIETPPGQIRYNIIDIGISGQVIKWENVTLRLANIYPDITIERTIIHATDWDGHYSPALKIDISSKAATGDYKFEVQAFINGKYQGKIPFMLHVTK